MPGWAAIGLRTRNCLMSTTRSRLSAYIACVLAALSLTALADPSARARSPAQTLAADIDVGPLRVAMVDIEGHEPQVYYYMTYRVTNNSGQDLQFAPIFEAGTDEGELFRAGRDVPRAVRLELLDRLGTRCSRTRSRSSGPCSGQGERQGRAGGLARGRHGYRRGFGVRDGL